MSLEALKGSSRPFDERLQVARTPFWSAVDRAKRGEIRDAISVAAIFRVALMALQGELPEEIAKAIGRPK